MTVNQYGLILDGSPLFADAESVVIRFVHKKRWKVIELIIHVALYANSLDGEAIVAIAKHISDALKEYKLNGKFWRVAMLDHAGTNKTSLSLLTE